MDLIYNVNTSSDIIAVRLKVVAGDLTSLNDNATVDDVYIATLVSGAGKAVFEADATKPTALYEPDLLDIPADGIPTGNYSISTTEDDISGAHSWDVVDSDIPVFGADLAAIISAKASLVASPTNNNLVKMDGDGDLADAAVQIQTSTTTSFSNSDAKVITDKFIKTLLASVANGKGAALIGSEDSGGYFTATTVEGILQEMGAILNNMTMSLADESCILSIHYVSLLNRCNLYTEFIEDSNGVPAQGSYRLQYVFKNAVVAEPPNDINWATEATELASSNSFFNVDCPDPGDVLYSGGTAGYCYLYARIRFENLSSEDNETAWSYDSETIEEPETLGNEFVRLISEGNSDAVSAVKLIAADYIKSPVAAAMNSSYNQQHTSGTGAPAGTPTALGQQYVNESNGDIYGASFDGTDYSWVLIYDAS
jgi:hypothetical protein